ncbi:ThuA domain-containing protein [Microbacterium sp. NPDC056234]|uniref:ThuA domain-containing protein n=1 Tax=Microbacterium sp. NPDC056234 TaxID=3345757 RepID=UPI0035D7BF4B
MTIITVLSGAGPYGDPWHPFDETSAEIADVLAPLGQVLIRRDVDHALLELEAPRRPDLLVVNIGNPRTDSPPLRARRALDRAVRDGMPLLGVHSSATTFSAWEGWSGLLGGLWVRGKTFHPEASECKIHLTEEGRNLMQTASDFDTFDERYTALSLRPESTPLAFHSHDGQLHPLAWLYEVGSIRAVYDGLGHDAEAYRLPGPRAFLHGCASFLLGVDPSGTALARPL